MIIPRRGDMELDDTYFVTPGGWVQPYGNSQWPRQIARKMVQHAFEHPTMVEHAGEVAKRQRLSKTKQWLQWRDQEDERKRKVPEVAPAPAPAPAPKRNNDSNDEGSSKRRKVSTKSATKSRVIGKTGRRFGRARKPKYSKYARPGVQLVSENRTTVTDGQCVYIGYGVPVNQAVRAALYAVVKKLFTVAGHQVKNFDEVIPNVTGQKWTIDMKFWASAKSTGLTTISATIDYTANKTTYTHMADLLNAALDTFVTAGQSLFQIQWHEATLESTDSGAANQKVAEIPLDKTYIEMSYSGSCRLQNSTQAAGGISADAKFNTDRIDVNPLKGIKYVSTRMNNAILPRIRDENNQGGYLAFMANHDSGLFNFGSTQLAGAFGAFKEGMSVGFYKPPPASTFEYVKTTGVSLEPGNSSRQIVFQV